jgi:hypothetical protein
MAKFEYTVPAFAWGTRENHDKPQDSRSPGRDLNPGPPKYHDIRLRETGMGRIIKSLLKCRLYILNKRCARIDWIQLVQNRI